MSFLHFMNLLSTNVMLQTYHQLIWCASIFDFVWQTSLPWFLFCSAKTSPNTDLMLIYYQLLHLLFDRSYPICNKNLNLHLHWTLQAYFHFLVEQERTNLWEYKCIEVYYSCSCFLMACQWFTFFSAH